MQRRNEYKITIVSKVLSPKLVQSEIYVIKHVSNI